MATVTAYAGGYTNQTGAATWASQSSAQGSTTGTYATWTNSTNGATAGIDYNGFGTWSGIPAGATINSVKVSIKGYVNNTSRISAITARAYIGTTAKGSGASSLTLSTTSTNVYADITYTDISLADLQANTLLIRLALTHGANSQSGVAYFDYFAITVDYTPAPQTLSADASSSAGASASAAGSVAAAGAWSGSITLHLTGNNLTGSSPYLTAFTPTADSRLFVFLIAEQQNQAVHPDLGAAGVISDDQSHTWTLEAVSDVLGTQDNGDMWSGQGALWSTDIGSSPSSMTIQIDPNLTTTNSYTLGYEVFSVTGLDATYLRQSVAQNEILRGQGSSTLSLTATLGSTPTSGDLLIGMFGSQNDAAGAYATPTGWTELVNVSAGFQHTGVWYRYDSPEQSITCSDLGQTIWWAFAVLIDLAPVSSSGTQSAGASSSAGASASVDTSQTKPTLTASATASAGASASADSTQTSPTLTAGATSSAGTAASADTTQVKPTMTGTATGSAGATGSAAGVQVQVAGASSSAGTGASSNSTQVKPTLTAGASSAAGTSASADAAAGSGVSASSSAGATATADTTQTKPTLTGGATASAGGTGSVGGVVVKSATASSSVGTASSVDGSTAAVQTAGTTASAGTVASADSSQVKPTLTAGASASAGGAAVADTTQTKPTLTGAAMGTAGTYASAAGVGVRTGGASGSAGASATATATQTAAGSAAATASAGTASSAAAVRVAFAGASRSAGTGAAAVATRTALAGASATAGAAASADGFTATTEALSGTGIILSVTPTLAASGVSGRSGVGLLALADVGLLAEGFLGEVVPQEVIIWATRVLREPQWYDVADPPLSEVPVNVGGD